MNARFRKNALPCPELAERLNARFGESLKIVAILERRGGHARSVQGQDLLLRVAPTSFAGFVRALFEFDGPVFHGLFGESGEEGVLLHYHFSLFQRRRGSRVGIQATVPLHREELSIPSLVDLLPSAEGCERRLEKILGVSFHPGGGTPFEEE
ncbi:MAG: NADH-quinone oxidoreductase subunit C [Fretibacterium sp.]|uniref:NADH-quinone oxidoreductase subunit C n=1 Tax=Fretibacterium sp. OH1220_COT-178 TaxID=2491047 RepID=UPI000F5F6F2D|nr:NADH-quinone oxidoreductase subunit C [Fretibacterium sp. OH1220_COT-178]MDO4785307.1 NADH-quinone oxidoreductase subunit C [Fretibacterium sp.]RRD65870.1 hypothetical protein EII26_02065 [Fretibacterium sp. OH1220_COT-178]